MDVHSSVWGFLFLAVRLGSLRGAVSLTPCIRWVDHVVCALFLRSPLLVSSPLSCHLVDSACGFPYLLYRYRFREVCFVRCAACVCWILGMR